MSRGDKRDRDRAKNQAKNQAKLKSNGKTGNLQERNESDKAALETKIAQKTAQRKAAEETAANDIGTTKIVRKKGIKKVDLALDDLLNVGLKAKLKR